MVCASLAPPRKLLAPFCHRERVANFCHNTDSDLVFFLFLFFSEVNVLHCHLMVSLLRLIFYSFLMPRPRHKCTQKHPDVANDDSQNRMENNAKSVSKWNECRNSCGRCRCVDGTETAKKASPPVCSSDAIRWQKRCHFSHQRITIHHVRDKW